MRAQGRVKGEMRDWLLQPLLRYVSFLYFGVEERCREGGGGGIEPQKG